MKNVVPVPIRGPGEIKAEQNWIGGTRPGPMRFNVPAPPLAGRFARFPFWRNTSCGRSIASAGPTGTAATFSFRGDTSVLEATGAWQAPLITLLLDHWNHRYIENPLLYLRPGTSNAIVADTTDCMNAVRTDGRFRELAGGISWRALRSLRDETVGTTQQLFALINSDRTNVLAGRATSVAGIRPSNYDA